MPKVTVREAQAPLSWNRWRWLAVVILFVGAGCPSEFGVNGRIDKAIAHDQAQEDCPAHTHRENKKPACTGRSCDWTCVAD